MKYSINDDCCFICLGDLPSIFHTEQPKVVLLTSIHNYEQYLEGYKKQKWVNVCPDCFKEENAKARIFEMGTN